MAHSMTLELNPDQQEILLRGLRYVKNAIALEVFDPTEDLVMQRNQQIREVAQLSQLISGQEKAHQASQKA